MHNVCYNNKYVHYSVRGSKLKRIIQVDFYNTVMECQNSSCMAAVFKLLCHWQIFLKHVLFSRIYPDTFKYIEM